MSFVFDAEVPSYPCAAYLDKDHFEDRMPFDTYTTPTSNSGSVMIGRMDSQYSFIKIDELTFWNRPFTADEIERLHNAVIYLNPNRMF